MHLRRKDIRRENRRSETFMIAAVFRWRASHIPRGTTIIWNYRTSWLIPVLLSRPIYRYASIVAFSCAPYLLLRSYCCVLLRILGRPQGVFRARFIQLPWRNVFSSSKRERGFSPRYHLRSFASPRWTTLTLSLTIPRYLLQPGKPSNACCIKSVSAVKWQRCTIRTHRNNANWEHKVRNNRRFASCNLIIPTYWYYVIK